jgi:hypothetical protein
MPVLLTKDEPALEYGPSSALGGAVRRAPRDSNLGPGRLFFGGIAERLTRPAFWSRNALVPLEVHTHFVIDITDSGIHNHCDWEQDSIQSMKRRSSFPLGPVSDAMRFPGPH